MACPGAFSWHAAVSWVPKTMSLLPYNEEWSLVLYGDPSCGPDSKETHDVYAERHQT